MPIKPSRVSSYITVIAVQFGGLGIAHIGLFSLAMESINAQASSQFLNSCEEI